VVSRVAHGREKKGIDMMFNRFGARNIGLLAVAVVSCTGGSPGTSDSESGKVGSVTQALDSVQIWGDPSGSQTITQASSTSLTVKGVMNAQVFGGINYVDQLATAGSGTSGSPWTGWETAVNALSAGTEIYFPAGYYTQASTIQMKPGWTLRGAGYDATFIKSGSTFTGDAIQSISPYNASTAVHIMVEDLMIQGQNTSPTGAAIDVVGGTYVNIKRVETLNYKYGIVLDQTELADVEECDIEATFTNTLAGIWLVNNSEHQAQGVPGVPTTPPGGVSGEYTNRIGIRKSQFNFGGPNGTAIMDDGGYVHEISGNNFNAGATAIHIAGAKPARITNNEFESTSSDEIISTYITAQGGLSGPGPNVNLYISDNQMTAGTHHAVTFVDGSPVVLVNNLVSSSVSAFSGILNIYELNATGNANAGTGGDFDSNPTVGLVAGAGSGTMVGVGLTNPTTPLDVKGDIHASGGVRFGTATAAPTCASTNRGELWFTQGATGVKDSAQVCAKDAANAYAWRTIY